MTVETLPRAARLLFWSTVVGGSACVVLRIPDIARWTAPQVPSLCALAGAILVTELFSLPLRIRTQTLNFMLTDAAWTVGLIVVRPSALTFALVIAVFAGQLIKGWDVHKVAFNVAVYVVGITGAEVIFRRLAGSQVASPTAPRTWLAAAVAMAAFAVVNMMLVASIIALVEGKPLAGVVVPSLGLDLTHRAGNLIVGLTLAVLLHVSPLAVPPALVLALLAFMAYRAWIETLRQRDHLRVLHEVEDRLLNPLDTAAELEPVLQLVKRMLQATSVELSIFDGEEARTYSSEGKPAPVSGNGNGHRRGA